MKRLLRILVVEDSENDAELLLEELRRGGFEVKYVVVDTPEAMRTALADHTWDVVVSDYTLPAFSGLHALAQLQETGIDIPLIITSGTIGEETAVEALKAGASDFLVKGRLARLVPAIERETREAEGRRARRAAEEALGNMRARMQFTLEAFGIGVGEWDLRANSIVATPEFDRLHGLVSGRSRDSFEAYVDTVHADDRGAVRAKVEQAMREHGDWSVEYRVRRADGRLQWVRLLGRTLFDDGHNPVRMIGVGLDITAQKDLEEQLRQAQKLEAIGGLAAGLAHDFNNLLTIVEGYCELLAPRLAADAEGMRDLDQVRRAGASAAALTRQLLAFSRRQVLSPQVVDLNGILTNTRTMVRRLLEENVQIDFRLADRLPSVNVDPGQIEQVLLNLVINARDAMPDGGVVTVETSEVFVDEPYARTHLDVQPGPYVLICISDTGTGMSPEVQSRLFEPFFTTKERGRGTGLGLATVYGIVRQSGGHIWVYSEVGMGTTFKIYWPVAQAAAPAPEIAPVRRNRAELAGEETILVVEDAEPLRALTERILRRNGYAVLSAANGEEAQRVCTEHQGPIHVALMDVVMPGMSGRAVSEWIGRFRPATKVVFVSGYTDNAITHHGILEPGLTFLPKPFTPDALLKVIRDVLA